MRLRIVTEARQVWWLGRRASSRPGGFSFRSSKALNRRGRRGSQSRTASYRERVRQRGRGERERLEGAPETGSQRRSARALRGRRFRQYETEAESATRMDKAPEPPELRASREQKEGTRAET